MWEVVRSVNKQLVDSLMGPPLSIEDTPGRHFLLLDLFVKGHKLLQCPLFNIDQGYGAACVLASIDE